MFTIQEREKLMISLAAMVARDRRQRGVKLNHPEALALISSQLIEWAREGREVADLMDAGAGILTTDEVMPGVENLLDQVQIEATFPDGTKLVTVHYPIREGKRPVAPADIPGEVLPLEGEIDALEGREQKTLTVRHTGDRPIQVGSHYHFYEVNKALDFNRNEAWGYRLAIPSGTAVRFEPGQTKNVELVALAGERVVYGFNALVSGRLDDSEVQRRGRKKAIRENFRGAK